MSIISQIMTGKKLSEIEELIETAHLGTIGGPGNHVQKILYCPPKLVGRLIGKVLESKTAMSSVLLLRASTHTHIHTHAKHMRVQVQIWIMFEGFWLFFQSNRRERP